MERYKDKQLSAYERAAALADTLSTEEQAQQLKELMEFFETEPKIVERKERMVSSFSFSFYFLRSAACRYTVSMD